MMQLDDAQRRQVSEWIAQGLKLSQIQSGLASQFGLRLTYMDVRLLVDDLKLVPKDAEPRKEVNLAAAEKSPGKPAPPQQEKAGGVSVSVDQLTRPGAVVSGKASFSDGVTADWYLDQTGRLGMVAPQPGYRPPAADLQKFQAALDQELSKLGL